MPKAADKPIRKHPPIAAGQKYGRLKAISFARKDRHRSHYWLFRCDCGNDTVVAVKKVKSGHTQSCGCLHREVVAERGRRNTRHGRTGTPEYTTWLSMIKRCGNPDHKSFENYGGRGITVCKRWLKFEDFFADMGFRPSANHSIDRVDNDKGYFRENCRWATKKEQARNRRNNVFVEFAGQRVTLAEGAELTRLHLTTIWRRLKVLGWSPEDAVNTPKTNRWHKGRK